MFRYASSVYGQTVLIGASWDLIPWFFGVGAVLILVHALVMAARRTRPAAPVSASSGGERILRHRLADRIFHWTMAAAVLTCGFTAFLPILGIKFAWLTIHWIAGVVLTALILFHIVRAIFWLDFWSIVIGPRDFGLQRSRQSDQRVGKDAKYTPLQKLFHKAVTLALLAMIVTGLLMLSKIDTPFWRRNPYWLAEAQWGWIYVVHGLSAMAMITLVMLHVYFALRPEKLWITRSMIHGWITRENYLKHHDPLRWPVKPAASDNATYPAGE